METERQLARGVGDLPDAIRRCRKKEQNAMKASTSQFRKFRRFRGSINERPPQTSRAQTHEPSVQSEYLQPQR